MRFVTLTMATGNLRYENSELPTEGHGEDDMDEDMVSSTPVRVEETKPVVINADNISHMYPRKPNRDGSPRPGTRIVLKTSAAIPVIETMDQVQALLAVH